MATKSVQHYISVSDSESLPITGLTPGTLLEFHPSKTKYRYEDGEWKLGWEFGTGSGGVGPAGPEGPQGEQGVAGADGQPGAKGDTGDTGAKGDTGADSTVAGPEGPEGPQGERGLKGAKGPKGDPGADGGCDMSSDQCAGVKGNTDLSATNHVVDMDLLLLHENNNLRHLSIDERAALSDAPHPLSAANPVVDTDTLQIYIDTFTAHSRDEHLHLTADENAALENSENPLTGTNFVVDKALLESAVLILNDNIDNVVSDFDNHKTDYTRHLGIDQNNAFDGANSPSASNVLATMNDIPAPAPPAEALHESIPTIEMDIAGLLPSKIQCQGAFDDYGFDELKNAVFFIVDTHGGFRPNYIVHYYQGNQEFYVIMMPKAM